MILMYKKEGSPSGLGHYLDSTLYALTVTKMKFLFTFVIMWHLQKENDSFISQPLNTVLIIVCI